MSIWQHSFDADPVLGMVNQPKNGQNIRHPDYPPSGHCHPRLNQVGLKYLAKAKNDDPSQRE
jgi:hypothetical protein